MKALKTIPVKFWYDAEKLYCEWKDRHTSEWNLLKLRKECPCATCRGGDFCKYRYYDYHIKEAAINHINYVGRYAINILWADNHSTGIYTYQKLRESSDNQD